LTPKRNRSNPSQTQSQKMDTMHESLEKYPSFSTTQDDDSSDEEYKAPSEGDDEESDDNISDALQCPEPGSSMDSEFAIGSGTYEGLSFLDPA
ncbi:hypothetical protein HDU91_003413, partial [Kappamyces sp. JEL0680]